MPTLAEFETTHGKLNAHERRLLNASVKGELCVISQTRPDTAVTKGELDYVVRAEFIRWLALGSDATYPLHAHGLQLQGAVIQGPLDFFGATVHVTLGLVCCYFEQAPNFMGTQLHGSLFLSGSLLLTGLKAGGAEIAGSVFLSVYDGQDFESKGEIRLLGASIRGDLDCDGAKLHATDGQYALIAQIAQIAGNVFLTNNFENTGEINFASASVKNIFQLRSTQQPVTRLDLSHASVGFLESDPKAWGEGLVLDGLVYGSLRGDFGDNKAYQAWLAKQVADDYGTKEKPQAFKPQPWQQLIGVLRKMGHNDIANEMAIAFEKRRHQIGKLKHPVHKSLHQVFGWLAGYGYRPLRLLGWMLGVWLFLAMVYFYAAYQGVFTPSDPLVFQNKAYEAACRSYNVDGTARTIHNSDADGNTHNWYTCGALMGEYVTFSPLAYSLDVILPLVDLGQEKAWGVYIATPKSNAVYELAHSSFNHVVRLLVWFEIIFGWVASLILVAVLTGLTERNKP